MTAAARITSSCLFEDENRDRPAHAALAAATHQHAARFVVLAGEAAHGAGVVPVLGEARWPR